MCNGRRNEEGKYRNSFCLPGVFFEQDFLFVFYNFYRQTSNIYGDHMFKYAFEHMQI